MGDVSYAKSYYELLDLPRDADDKAIKKAYRAAAKEHHPDLPANRGDRDAARQFKLIKEAYEVLSDPERRRRYDAYGRDRGTTYKRPFSEADGSPRRHYQTADELNLKTNVGEGVASIFEDLFAVDPSVAAEAARPRDNPWDPAALGAELPEDRPPAARGRGKKKGAPSPAASSHRFGFNPEDLAEAALWGDLQDADASISPGSEPPPFARGKTPNTGRKSAPRASRGSRPEPAPRRGDDLEIPVQVPFLTAVHGGPLSVSYRVPDGEGNWVLEEAEIEVPAASESGGTLLLNARGRHGQGTGSRGDLRMRFEVQDHPWFKREGRHIVVELPLSPWEAASGKTLRVPTVHGSATVQVPPRVRSGQRIRLKNLGLPASRAGGPGHQILVVRIDLPTNLGKEELDSLRKLDEASGFNPRGHLWEDEQG